MRQRTWSDPLRGLRSESAPVRISEAGPGVGAGDCGVGRRHDADPADVGPAQRALARQGRRGAPAGTGRAVPDARAAARRCWATREGSWACPGARTTTACSSPAARTTARSAGIRTRQAPFPAGPCVPAVRREGFGTLWWQTSEGVRGLVSRVGVCVTGGGLQGTIMCELPAGGNWNFDVRWSPKVVTGACMRRKCGQGEVGWVGGWWRWDRQVVVGGWVGGWVARLRVGCGEGGGGGCKQMSMSAVFPRGPDARNGASCPRSCPRPPSTAPSASTPSPTPAKAARCGSLVGGRLLSAHGPAAALLASPAVCLAPPGCSADGGGGFGGGPAGARVAEAAGGGELRVRRAARDLCQGPGGRQARRQVLEVPTGRPWPPVPRPAHGPADSMRAVAYSRLLARLSARGALGGHLRREAERALQRGRAPRPERARGSARRGAGSLRRRLLAPLRLASSLCASSLCLPPPRALRAPAAAAAALCPCGFGRCCRPDGLALGGGAAVREARRPRSPKTEPEFLERADVLDAAIAQVGCCLLAWSASAFRLRHARRVQ